MPAKKLTSMQKDEATSVVIVQPLLEATVMIEKSDHEIAHPTVAHRE